MFKKCFFCPSLVDMFIQSPSTAYRRDYLLMAQDDKVYSCPYCDVFNGYQIEIDQHLDRDCPQYTEHCICGTARKRVDFQSHHSVCPYWERCPHCLVYFQKHEMKTHRILEHDEFFCHLCSEFILHPHQSVHFLEECPARIIRCGYCKENFQFRDRRAHMEKHEKEFQKRFEDTTKEVTLLLEQYRFFMNQRDMAIL